MSRTKHIWMCLFGAIGLYAPVCLARDGIYVSGDVGVMFRSNDNFPTEITNAAGLSDQATNGVKYDAAPQAEVALGDSFASFRAEIELGYAGYKVKSAAPLSLNGVFPSFDGRTVNLSSGGHRDTLTTTVNGFYDIPVPGLVQPYLGGGLGFAHNGGANALFDYPNGAVFTQRWGGNENRAIALGEAGVAFRLSHKLALTSAYRYTHDFTSSDKKTLGANTVKVGARYAF